MKNETIAAVATAMTDSGIGIIRISGKDAVEIADKIYKSPGRRRHLKDYESHTINYGFIYEGDELLDEVMVSIMKAPRSYTAEDTVEINCHGGALLLQRILEAVLKNGARLAEPGEFTKRAFLNGRMDLARAEAVIDMIHSQNEFALKASVSQLRGLLSDKIKKLREDIIYEIAFIESALDDPEHISLDGYYEKLSIKLEHLIMEIKGLLDTADYGRMLKEGIKTVIVGKPNAGKSSILNILVGEERAIVTDVAGTTRDILEENIRIHGISLNIIDTAGIRSTEDIVEKIGVDKAKKYVKDAELVLYVVDASVPLDESDEEIMRMLQDKNTIVLLNKSDLEAAVKEETLFLSSGGMLPEHIRFIKTSAKENTGIDEFEDALKKMFLSGKIKTDGETVITSLRHKEALKDAYESLCLVRNSIGNRMPEDFLSIDMMNAYSSLGLIIGEEVEEDLVNEIFSKFCIGK